MATLTLLNYHGVTVHYKTDLLKGNNGRFTIMEISDMSDKEIEHGMDFKCIESDLASFIDFAERHNLMLIRTDVDGTISNWDYTEGSDSESIFV